MRFSCEKCNAQYAISDEKVGQKGVKVRCKRCGFIITVRPEQAAEVPAQDKTQVDQAPQEEGGQLAESAGMAAEAGAQGAGDEIGQALDAMFGQEAPPGAGAGDEQAGEEDDDEDLDRQSTRVFNVEEMQRVQSEKEQATRRGSEGGGLSDIYNAARAEELGQAAGGAATTAPVDRDSPQWWAAVNEQQIGPMNLIELEQRLQRGELDADAMVWKAGFAEWTAISTVDELRGLLAPARAAEPKVGSPEPESREEELGEPAAEDHPQSEPEDLSLPEGDYEGGRQIDYDEAEAAALSGTGVDWVPSGIAELESLAESELAFLRPKEEVEEPPPSEPSPAEAEISGETAPMDDGDSSIVEKLAREQQEAAAREEERRREMERQAAEAQQKERERELEAQAAAQREREKEQRERVSKAPEQVLPTTSKSGVPRWVVYGGFGLGGVLVLLLVVVAYKLFTVPAPVLSNAVSPGATTPATAPVTPEKVAMAEAPATATAPTEAGVPPSAAAPAEPEKPAPEAETPAHKAEAVAAKRPATAPPKPRTATPRAPKPPVIREEKPRIEKEPPSEPQEPKRPRKSGGGILDFEDEAAFARETGSGKPVATAAPEPPPKKELPPLSNADVLGVMRQHLEEFKACNRKQQELDANIKGKMVVKFTVRPDGRVTQVMIETAEFKNTFVADCIGKVIRQSHFPEFGGGPKTVPFPFTVK